MSAVEDAAGESVPPRRKRPHYHGDETRVIFLVSALVIFLSESLGADLPLSTVGSIIAAVLLVIAAGITNPMQPWIHWVNAFLAIIGTIVFGTSAVNHYRAGLELFDTSFAAIEALALLSLLALYFTTRTIRGTVRPQTTTLS